MKQKHQRHKRGGQKCSPGMEGRNSYLLQFERPYFTGAELKALIAMVDANAREARLIKNKDREQATKLRRSSVVWLEKKDFPDIYRKIVDIARDANQIYDYDVYNFQGPLQVAVYDESNQGFFGWHTDTVPSDMSRKISISIPLNKQSEYEGGDFEVREGNVERAVPQVAGFPLVFPSWLPHRVTAVTGGRRYSMVAWILGPYWR